MDMFQTLSGRLPKCMHDENRYLELVNSLNSSNKCIQFLEEQFFLQSMLLTDKEVWHVIQKLVKDVNEKHELDPLFLQEWIVHLKANWETVNVENVEKTLSSARSESSEGSSSTTTSSSNNKSRKRRKIQPPTTKKRREESPSSSSSTSTSSSSSSSKDSTSSVTDSSSDSSEEESEQ